jgi:oxygen-independent coproporphyrinogen-3 oxidase
MEQDISPSPLSLYIHIPFCLSKCGYCSFFSLPYSRKAIPEYLSVLQQEKALYVELLERPLDTLYFGGGSPSLLSYDQIISLCEGLNLNPTTEITLEINPLQINTAFLQELRKTSVNRISLGLQSMNNRDLAWLDRKHKAEQIKDKLSLCRDFGYDNISLDLMYGLPGSNLDRLKHNLDAFLDLQPEHISTYLLSLDEDCARYAEEQSLSALPDGESCARQYQLIRNSLLGAGFQHYEISNFARRGKASRHNLAYWQSREYLALGAAAAGWIVPCRYQNPDDLAQYYAGVHGGERFPGKQLCDSIRQREDYLMMGLRLIQGIDLHDFKQRFGHSVSTYYGKQISHLQKLGMLTLTTRRLALTPEALFISNSVIGELIL